MPKILISKTFSFFIFFIVLLLTNGTTYQGKTFLFIEKKEKSSPNFLLQDGSKKIILNANAFQQADDQELRGFLRYVRTGEVTTEYTRRIEDMIRTVKISEQMRKEYRILPAVIMDAIDEGEARDSRPKALETAKTMLTMGYPLDDICKITGLTPARCSRSVPCNDTGVKTLAEPEPFARFLRQR